MVIIMFIVQPVRSRELQSEMAKQLGTEFLSNTYAFFAADVDEDATSILSIIALCQFEYSPEKAVIKSISTADGRADDEAVVIMVRAVMNYCYRAELPIIMADPSSADEAFLRSVSFRKVDGEWSIDLKKFYKSPCHYNDEKN